MAAAVFAAFLTILLSSCGVPLAPGYQIQKEALTVQFVGANPPHLAIRVEYRLANIGNSPLHFIAATLPGEKEFGRANLRAEIDGKEIAAQQNPAESPDVWRIPLPVSWRQKEKRNLSLSYDLAAQPANDPRIFVAANTFYLNDSAWFPQLLGFKGLFAPTPARPNLTLLDVIIPADFRVTASGQPRGEKKQNGEITHQFRIRKADFDPYVLAGQYQEQKNSADGVTVATWTIKPIPAEQAKGSIAQIAAAAEFDSQTFGALPANTALILNLAFSESTSPLTKDGYASILPGAVNSSAPNWPAELAYTWFGHMMRPEEQAWSLADALSTYAAVAWKEKSGESRSALIASHLTNYDAERASVVEKAALSLTRNAPEAQLLVARDKSTLFLFALEDKCGQQNVTHAIAHMVYALHGQQYGYPDFRAALEHECHQNLADFFRTWLAQPGIPSDFRARYENAGTK